MHFLTPILIATALSGTMASPVPFNDIEKRWAEGKNEREIHPNLSHRDMTPAWPIARDSSNYESFATATDSRSIEVAEKRNTVDVGLLQRLKSFAEKVMREKGQEEGEVVVLRPRKSMRYGFTR